METSLLCWDCTEFFRETCCCECQWTEAEWSRMQLITEHPDVPHAAFSIITSNCHLLIHTGFRICFIYVLLICNFFALMQFQLLKNSSFCTISRRSSSQSHWGSYTIREIRQQGIINCSIAKHVHQNSCSQVPWLFSNLYATYKGWNCI